MTSPRLALRFQSLINKKHLLKIYKLCSGLMQRCQVSRICWEIPVFRAINLPPLLRLKPLVFLFVYIS